MTHWLTGCDITYKLTELEATKNNNYYSLRKLNFNHLEQQRGHLLLLVRVLLCTHLCKTGSEVFLYHNDDMFCLLKSMRRSKYIENEVCSL